MPETFHPQLFTFSVNIVVYRCHGCHERLIFLYFADKTDRRISRKYWLKSSRSVASSDGTSYKTVTFPTEIFC